MRRALVLVLAALVVPLGSATVTDPAQHDPGTDPLLGGDASDDRYFPTRVAMYGASSYSHGGAVVPIDDPRDHFSFELAEAGAFSVSIVPVPLLDVRLFLVDPAGVERHADAGGLGATETITVTGPAGTYTIGAVAEDVDCGDVAYCDYLCRLGLCDPVPPVCLECVLPDCEAACDTPCLDAVCDIVIRPIPDPCTIACFDPCMPGCGVVIGPGAVCGVLPDACDIKFARPAAEIAVPLAAGRGVVDYTLVVGCEPYCR